MVQSFSPTVEDDIGIVSGHTAMWIWSNIAREYGKSLAEERLTLRKELFDLRLEDNDYMLYMRKFK
jgi:hypothetical protein